MTGHRVLLVEDDTFARTTMAAALSAVGMHLVLATNQASAAVRACEQQRVDVALLDLDLGPGPTGIDAAVLLRRAQPDIGIVFLTSYSDPRLLGSGRQSLPPGSRYLTKSKLEDMRPLVQVINQVAASPLRAPVSKDGETSDLTDHQISVLRLVAEGLSSAEIAQRLGVSQKAVEASISRINHALGIEKTRSENVRVQLARSYFRLTGRKPPRG